MTVIIEHAHSQWLHIPTGTYHILVWVSPREVISVSDEGAWLGPASMFVREFGVVP